MTAEQNSSSKPTSRFYFDLLLVVLVVLFTVFCLYRMNRVVYPEAQDFIDSMIEGGMIELLTVSPELSSVSTPEMPQESRGKNIPDGDSEVAYLGDYKILDSRIIEDQGRVRSLLKGLIGNKPLTMCIFSPRHAIRIVDKPENYLLICFQCNEFEYSHGSSGTLNDDVAIRKRFMELANELGMITSP